MGEAEAGLGAALDGDAIRRATAAVEEATQRIEQRRVGLRDGRTAPPAEPVPSRRALAIAAFSAAAGFVLGRLSARR